jgi:HEAT repeat protein
VSLTVKASELLADSGPVASAISALFERSKPGIMGHLRVAQALVPTGLDVELLNSLADADPDVRMAAARLCGALRMTSSVPWLADLLEDPEPGVRDAAVRALGQTGGRRAVDALMAASARLPRHRLVIELAHAASDMDIEALMREPASVEAAVVTVLACGLRRDRLRIEPLSSIALDRRWPARVRAAACRALAMIGDPAVAVRLAGLRGDPDAGVRLAAVQAQQRLARAGGQAPG